MNSVSPSVVQESGDESFESRRIWRPSTILNQDMLSTQTISSRWFYTQRFLFMLTISGPKATFRKISDILVNMAIILAFIGAFGNQDISDRVFAEDYTILLRNSTEYDRMLSYLAFSGPATQIVACLGFIVTMLMFIQLNFYDKTSVYEIAFYLSQFGWMLVGVTLTLVTSVALVLLSITGRTYLYFHNLPATWYTVLALTCVTAVFVITVLVWADTIQHKVRRDQHIPANLDEGKLPEGPSIRKLNRKAAKPSHAREKAVDKFKDPYLLTDAGIREASYASKLFLWCIRAYSSEQCHNSLQVMLITQGILLTFIASFVNSDLPSRAYADGVYDQTAVTFIGITAALAQIFACAGVILAVIMHTQLGFVDEEDELELAYFATRFGPLTSVVTGSVIVSVFLFLLVIDVRAFLLFNPYRGSWITIWVLTGVASLLAASAFPYMSRRMRRLREEQAGTDSTVPSLEARI